MNGKRKIQEIGSIAYPNFQAIDFLFHVIRAITFFAQRPESELINSSHITIYVVPVPIQQIKSGHV